MSAQPCRTKKVVDSYGGKEQFYEFFASVKNQIDAIDDAQLKETQDIGRILQAHLMVESLLTQYLQKANANLGPLTESSLTYSQKVDLFSFSKSSIYFLVPGLRCLDAIRNRLVHDPSALVTDRDKKVLLTVPLFKDVKRRLLPNTGGDKREDALTVMECFATFAGILLCNASHPDCKAPLMNAGRNITSTAKNPQ